MCACVRILRSAGGDLRSFMSNCGPLAESEARFYLSEMVMAVQDLHQLGYVHRDLKPGNFVLEQSGHLKLIDFGLSSEGVTAKLNDNYGSIADALRQSHGKSPYGSIASIRERRETRKVREENKRRRIACVSQCVCVRL